MSRCKKVKDKKKNGIKKERKAEKVEKKIGLFI